MMSSNLCVPSEEQNVVICGICPKACRLREGVVGNCRARTNKGGRVVPLSYGRICSSGMDPMEKKPLFHFFPGTPVLSFGMAGCNLHCKNCQNASISQVSPTDIPSQGLTPQDLVDTMKEHNIKSVAYTYTEPLVAYEYVYDMAKAVHEAGLYNVLVSAAYVNPEPLKALLPFIDAANVDLKTMNADGYRENSGVELETVLNSLRIIARSNTLLEVTDLVIPGFNDGEENLRSWCKFVYEELGEQVPVHFSRFFPQYKMTDREATPMETMALAKDIALQQGLKFVYTGNVDGDEYTYCPECGQALICRNRFLVKQNILQNGCCPKCGKALHGRF